MRYEHNTNDYSLNTERGAGQLPPAVPPPGQQRKVTQKQDDDVDLFSGHGITETRITDNLWFTAGYSYTTITNDLSGSRIFGTHWDEAFGEPVPTLGNRDHAFIDLAGTAQIRENVFNANLFWMPFESLAILTGFRYTHENNDSDSTFLEEEPVPNTPPFTPLNPDGGFHFGPPIPSRARATQITTVSPRGWRCVTPVLRIGSSISKANGKRNSGKSMSFKASTKKSLWIKTLTRWVKNIRIGATWYPTMRLNLAGQYFHRIASYDEDVFSAQYPRLINQDWNVDDFNVRMTFRPKLPSCMGTLLWLRATILCIRRSIANGEYFHRKTCWPNCKVAKLKSM